MSLPTEPAITLYDIASALTPQAWSPNPWKARLVLDYKRIPYKTVYVSYPDIQSTVKELHGVPTSTPADGSSGVRYTLPTIVDASAGTTNPVVITDSLAIAEYLDAKYPERPVFPKIGKAHEYIFEEFFMSTIHKALLPLLLPLAIDVLDERGQDHFRKMWKQSNESLDRDAQWKEVKKAFDSLAAMLDKNGLDLDFVSGGTEPTRADMILLSYFAWIKRVAPEEGWNDKIKHWNGGRWEKLWNRSEGWRSIQ